MVLLLLPLLVLTGCSKKAADHGAPSSGGGVALNSPLANVDTTSETLVRFPLVGPLMLGSRAQGLSAAQLSRLTDIDNAAKVQALAAATAFDEVAARARTELATGAISDADVDALVHQDRALREVALHALVDGMAVVAEAPETPSPVAGGAGKEQPAVAGAVGLLVSAEERSAPPQPENAAYTSVYAAESARATAWKEAFSAWVDATGATGGQTVGPDAYKAATEVLFDAGDTSMRVRLTLAPKLLAAASDRTTLLASEPFAAWLDLAWEGKPRAAGLPVPVASVSPMGMQGGMQVGMQGGMFGGMMGGGQGGMQGGMMAPSSAPGGGAAASAPSTQPAPPAAKAIKKPAAKAAPAAPKPKKKATK